MRALMCIRVEALTLETPLLSLAEKQANFVIRRRRTEFRMVINAALV